jgi:hypothetical protein
VERAIGGAPVAFRIWRAGVNVTDYGAHSFTARSAERLMAEQAARGNLYSVDVDHMSLNQESPPESRKAVGWHRLQVRDSDKGPELWAIDVEWTDVVRAGLEKRPPEWRYFSPAYDIDPDTGEITSYLNTALTNNPATWRVTSLAVRPGGMTKWTTILAALISGTPDRRAEAERVLAAKKYEAIIADLMGQDEDKKAAAIAALAAAFPDEKEPDGDEKAKKAAADDADAKAKKAAADAEAAKKAAEDKPDEAAAIAATEKLLTTIGDLDKRLQELEAVNETAQRAKILATRSDLTTAQLKVLETEPLARLPKLLELIPKPKEDPAAAARVTATRGAHDGQAFGAQRASRLPPQEREDLRERMGADAGTKGIYWDPHHRSDLVFSTMNREEARSLVAVLAKRKADAAARRSATGGAS